MQVQLALAVVDDAELPGDCAAGRPAQREKLNVRRPRAVRHGNRDPRAGRLTGRSAGLFRRVGTVVATAACGQGQKKGGRPHSGSKAPRLFPVTFEHLSAPVPRNG
ncbi:hypothetical protein GCM10010187_35120 [Actinomadura coerulea]|nr:hypothetical protein GCM10010187_35120 [Actinomadura coerulea]